jgi:uncharacterized protein YggT (Ycf19 family)
MTHRDYDQGQDPDGIRAREAADREPVRSDRVEDRPLEPETVTHERVERAPVEREVVEREVVEREPVDRPARVATTGPTVVEHGPSGGELLRRVVTLAFGILQSLLILRIILLLLIANTANQIVAFILTVTDPFVEPFRGMFQLDRVADQTGVVLDVAAIVALIGWTLVEVLILAVLSLGSRRRDVAV